MLIPGPWHIYIFFFPEDSEEGEEWEEEQDYPEEDAATEDETSDIAEGESSGRNMFSDSKANEKIRNSLIKLTESLIIEISFLQKMAKKTKSGEMNKIILMKMLPLKKLRRKRMILLRMKTQVIKHVHWWES